MPGVVGAWSGDLAADWGGPLPMVWPITEDIKTSDHWPITKDKARFQGDGVAVVVAESRGLANDAAEVVEVVRTAQTGPRHRGGSEGRLPARARRAGDQRRGPLEPRRRRRPGRVRQRARAAAAPVRGAQDHAQPDRAAWRARVVVPAMGEFTLWTSTQIPHIARVTCRAPPGSPSTSCGSSRRTWVGRSAPSSTSTPEEALCLALARRTGRAVKWIEDRSELRRRRRARGDPRRRGGGHRGGQDPRVPGEGAGRHGRVLPAPHAGDPELGAGSTWALRHAGYWYEFTGVMTNMAPTDAVRGAGRPGRPTSSNARWTRSRHVGKDPAEIRRISFAPSHAGRSRR